MSQCLSVHLGMQCTQRAGHSGPHAGPRNGSATVHIWITGRAS